jgi:hypothetical protein
MWMKRKMSVFCFQFFYIQAAILTDSESEQVHVNSEITDLPYPHDTACICSKSTAEVSGLRAGLLPEQ